jgi:DNA helicase II / ATP-dependent DNA helicase PcrA
MTNDDQDNESKTPSLTDTQQSLVKAEEAIVSTIVTDIQGALQKTRQRFATEEMRSRDLTATLVAATTDEDKQLIASDEAVSHALREMAGDTIPILEQQIDHPYFARFCTEEEVNDRLVQREYRLGFSANADHRIIDWRKAPLAKLYYEYKEGDEFSEEIQGQERYGTITMRNSVEIKKGELLKLTCGAGTMVKRQGVWEGALASRSRTPSSGSYGQLPSILSLITAEQFKTITLDAKTAILIQGIAGSGKTTVALHRLAWLLHENNSDLKPHECVVLVLNPFLKAYISHTLPSMEVEGVRVITLYDWACDAFAKSCPSISDEVDGVFRLRLMQDSTPASIVRVRRSLAILRYMEQREQELRSRTEAGIKALLEKEQVTIPAQILTQQKDKPLLSFLTAVLSTISRDTTIASEAKQALVERLQRAIEGASDLPRALKELYLQPAEIIKLDTTRLIDKEIIAAAANRLDACLEAGAIDDSDIPLLLRLYQLRLGALPTGSKSTPLFRHIVVDEVQDFGSVDLAVVVHAVEHTHQLTLVGDTAQELGEHSAFPGWEGEEAAYCSLTVSHRSTLQIMRLADYVQERQLVTDGRAGRPPRWYHSRHEERSMESGIRWLQAAVQQFPGALTAVICASKQEAKQAHSLLEPTFGPVVRLADQFTASFEEGIVVAEVSQVKGLEFFSVLLWNPNNQSYQKTTEHRNRLYVALSRAEEHLCIITWGKPSLLLPSIESKLVRGENLDEGDEDA